MDQVEIWKNISNINILFLACFSNIGDFFYSDTIIFEMYEYFSSKCILQGKCTGKSYVELKNA